MNFTLLYIFNDLTKDKFLMHEMSIALNILDIVEKELKKADGKKIERLNLVVGKLSGVVVESLQFALEASRNSSAIADAEIIIDEVAATMKCMNCDFEFKADDFYTICPKCNSFKHQIMTGKELFIKSLTIQQD